ncbi:MAG: dihydrofolate reductase [Patescibacteria group bacterium]|nr:dihydrofolate reductase [Patescibacteria group bacterium]
MSAKISIIVATAKDRAIGKDNCLLWDIPADLKHFKELTSGHPVIMGQKTFESIGRPLPGRTNIVLCKEGVSNEGCITVNSIPEAIRRAKSVDNEEVFIIGGGSIYAQTLELADRLYLTLVEGDYGADTYFPEYEHLFKNLVFSESGESNGYRYKFLVLEK